MSYKDCSIRQAITDIDQNKVFLPALQRKFVWDKNRIELLFDSIMRSYPISTFLFWRLDRQKAESYVFYDFLKEYDERNPYNRRHTGAFLHEEITGVLDGQQRLSSMYLGLMGTHTEKAPRKWSTSEDAYPRMSLYLNLLSLPYELDANNDIQPIEEQDYQFLFLKPESARAEVERRAAAEEGEKGAMMPVYWMKVREVLSWGADPEFGRLIEKFTEGCSNEAQRNALIKQRRFVEKALRTLHDRINRDKLVNYFEVAKDDLEDILKIFVRVNSGGTTLTKTDLLFSTIVATWDDGREEIEKLLKAINSKGDGFNFTNEYLMRCCLVLTDGPVIYKVNSFKSENVQKIRDEWRGIADAVIRTVELLTEFGFSGPLLTSQNATIILAYYIYKGGSLDKDSKLGMRKYLVHALLNTIYGSAQERLISNLRSAFRKEDINESGNVTYTLSRERFSFEELLHVELPQQKRLAITEEDLERLLTHTIGANSFFVLTLLYPHLRYSEVSFHQDHIHPSSRFSSTSLIEMGIPKEERLDWFENRDRVPNLQLLEGRRNESKNAKPLKEWIERMTPAEIRRFKEDNYFPDSVGLDFIEFVSFYHARKEQLKNALRKVLTMTVESPPSSDESTFGRQEQEPRPSERGEVVIE